ncbi:MAG: von Willebrand factor type A domain-containing protein [Chitinophagaceae bacterium]|nr:von Willebrand factor type A domain-containing protein [Chitinophagaceae bacterium]
MKILLVICCLLVSSIASAQYYVRGEIRDEKNMPVMNAKILLHSTNYLYSSGGSGSFGILIGKPADSITISLDGYQTLTLRVEAARYQQIVLKSLYTSSTVNRSRLVSVTKNLKPEDRENWSTGGETYSSLVENEFVSARKFPETGFSIHTDKASYSNIRRFLNMNTMVPPDAVRTEEVMNYFNFTYASPPKDSVFGFQSYISDCPWNIDSKLLYLHMCARKLDPEKIPASNLVFLIDVSGSMDMPNRLPLLKSAFKLLVDNLREKDTVSIVVYGSAIGVWMQPTSGKEKEKIRKSIEDLYPGGSTPGESGIRAAYRVAKSKFIQGGNNRVILATDGDFNVGQTSEDELDKLVTQHQQFGIYLTCLGVGMGNYKDSKLEVLSKKGNGNFAYLDNVLEAEKVLVKELTQTLYTVADDSYFSIQFNPRLVREYRLIGFDNKLKALADTLSEVEGGEVGSGHSLLALFELRTETGIEERTGSDKIAEATISFKHPGDSIPRFTSYKCPAIFTEFNSLPECYQFGTSLAMFTSILKDSKYARRIGWGDVQEIALKSMNKNDGLHKEYLQMIEKAKKIYNRSRKKKKEED